jgi:predicted transposase/invertase (TIGR01784 family)
MGWLNVRLQISVPKLLEKIAEVFEQMKRGEEGKVAEVVEVYYEKKFREVREQALLEGKLEGKLEGRLEEQLEVAKRLIAEGQFSVEKIAVLSGLTVDHVRGLMLN